MTETAAEPTAEQITLATIHQWADRMLAMTAEADARTRSGGLRDAARQVRAILDMNGRPPHEPVNFPPPD